MNNHLQAHESAMLQHYRTPPNQNTTSGRPINLHALIPFLAALFAWLMWLVFLLIPTLFRFDYAGMFPAVSNWAYVGMGLTLCFAATVAAWFQHGVRAIAFTFAVLLLSYWIF